MEIPCRPVSKADLYPPWPLRRPLPCPDMTAVGLSPLDPLTFSMQTATAYAHFMAGHYAEAASWAEASVRDRPDHLSGLRVLAASSAMLGRQEQAGKAMKRIRELDPTPRLSNLGYVS